MIQPRLHHSLPVEAEQLVSRALHFRFYCIRRERHDLRSGLSVPADEERVADTAQFMRLRISCYHTVYRFPAFWLLHTHGTLLKMCSA